MKDSLFEMLLTLFEKTLTQLKEQHLSKESEASESPKKVELEFVKPAANASLRVFTDDEKIRFTKASYQLLTRLISWGVIREETQELIINRLFFSDSRFVDVQETKWIIRDVLSETMSPEQMAFLELVLYQKEDKLPLH